MESREDAKNAKENARFGLRGFGPSRDNYSLIKNLASKKLTCSQRVWVFKESSKFRVGRVCDPARFEEAPLQCSNGLTQPAGGTPKSNFIFPSFASSTIFAV